MQLDAYFREVTQNPTATTRSNISLSGRLTTVLTQLGSISEAQIREWAVGIRFNGFANRLAMTHPWKGERTGVDWPPNLVMDPGLVGTAHTHPYAKKLSRTAKVGFSMGDLSFYAQMQQGAPIKTHFVVCCQTVFLAVYRDVTRTQLADDDWQALGTDENECDDLLLRTLHPNRFQASQIRDIAALAWDEADQAGQIDQSAAIERGLYQRAPGYVNLRTQANRRMILNAARVLRFDLYWGHLGGTLHLKSSRAHFSGGLKGQIQRAFG